MFMLIAILHVILAVVLVLVVLLQSGKGSDLATAFGGGASQTVFGSAGAASFLNKLTTVVAVCFMVTSLTLAMLVPTRSASVLPTEEPPAAEVPLVMPEPAGEPEPAVTGEIEEVPGTEAPAGETTTGETPGEATGEAPAEAPASETTAPDSEPAAEAPGTQAQGTDERAAPPAEEPATE